MSKKIMLLLSLLIVVFIKGERQFTLYSDTKIAWNFIGLHNESFKQSINHIVNYRYNGKHVGFPSFIINGGIKSRENYNIFNFYEKIQGVIGIQLEVSSTQKKIYGDIIFERDPSNVHYLVAHDFNILTCCVYSGFEKTYKETLFTFITGFIYGKPLLKKLHFVSNSLSLWDTGISINPKNDTLAGMCEVAFKKKCKEKFYWGISYRYVHGKQKYNTQLLINQADAFAPNYLQDLNQLSGIENAQMSESPVISYNIHSFSLVLGLTV